MFAAHDVIGIVLVKPLLSSLNLMKGSLQVNAFGASTMTECEYPPLDLRTKAKSPTESSLASVALNLVISSAFP